MVHDEINVLKDKMELSHEFKEGLNSRFGSEIINFINRQRNPLSIEQANSEFELIRIKGRFEGLRSVLDFINGKIQAGELARRELEEFNGQS